MRNRLSLRFMLGSAVLYGAVLAHASEPVAAGASTTANPASTATVSSGSVGVSPYHRATHSDSAELAYRLQWGVDNLEVRRTNSGALIRFSYRVVDVDKAKLVQDKRAEPYLIGERSHAMLKVPEMSNIGKLRQTESIAVGKDYWVLFSNKGDYVKAGDRVDIAIGTFYVNGLVVQ